MDVIGRATQEAKDENRHSRANGNPVLFYNRFCLLPASGFLMLAPQKVTKKEGVPMPWSSTSRNVRCVNAPLRFASLLSRAKNHIPVIFALPQLHITARYKWDEHLEHQSREITGINGAIFGFFCRGQKMKIEVISQTIFRVVALCLSKSIETDPIDLWYLKTPYRPYSS